MIKQKLDQCMKTNVARSIQIECGEIFKSLSKCKINLEKLEINN